jgi:peptidoglycan hydrolase-like protein with peptidoglycan-binding domain
MSLAALPACSSMSGGHASGASPMARRELSPGLVRQVQTALKQRGTYPGQIDGLWDPVMQGAVQNYQQSHGLAVNGQLDSPTLAALDIPGEGSVPAMQPATPAVATSSTTIEAPATPVTE